MSLVLPQGHTRAACRSPGTAALCLGLVLAVGCNRADAAALNTVATATGFFFAVTALLFSQAWPLTLTLDGLSTFVVVLAAAALLWRARRVSFAGRWSSALLPRTAARPACRALAGASVVLPLTFDRDELLAELRGQFVRLQAAWDAREFEVLRALTTPDMLAELCAHLGDCRDEPDRTDVLTLDAELVGFDELASAYLASVEFSGMIREGADRGAAPFRELWMLARPKQPGAAWRLARQLDLP